MKIWPFSVIKDLKERIDNDRELAWKQWHQNCKDIYDLQKRVKVIEEKQSALEQ